MFTTLRSTVARRPLAGFALALVLSTPVLADSPDDGFCHLSRWLPPELVPSAGAGTSVAFDGDTAVVGAPNQEVVYVFERVGGTWQQVQVLPSPAAPGSAYGLSVGLYGTSILVGAPGDTFAGPNAGSAYLYERDLFGWQLAQTFHGPKGSRFGSAVDVDASAAYRLAIGAPGGDGMTLLYTQVGGSWPFAQVLTQPDTIDFGGSLDLDGQTLVIGDWADETLGIAAGAVYHYLVLPAMVEFVQKITASDGVLFDKFGVSVAVDEMNRLVVGASGDDDAGPNTGAAYVYDYQPTPFYPFYAFKNEKKIVPTDAGLSANFGYSVDIDEGGQTLAIGAFDESDYAVGGAVHVYREFYLGPTWILTDLLAPADAAVEDDFGFAVRIAGSHVLAGSPGVDAAGPSAGAAYLFSLTRATEGGGQCPCDVLARAESFGVGKAGTLGVPVLSVSKPPVPGESSLFLLKNALAGTQPVIFWGSSAASIPFDGGTLYIGDPSGELMPVVGPLNQVGVQWIVPNLPALCGADVFFQAMFLDPGASGSYRTAQTNGLHTVIGY